VLIFMKKIMGGVWTENKTTRWNRAVAGCHNMFAVKGG
jgi:hypothetical protein